MSREADTPAPADTYDAAALRDRLATLHRDALVQLATLDGIDAGLLALAAHAGAAVMALDAAAEAAEASPGDRAVLVDDGRQITLVSYAANKHEPMAAIVLPPRVAIRLAGQLIAAGVRRL